MFAIYNEQQITNSTNNNDTFRMSFPSNYSLNEDQTALVQDLNNSALFYLEQDKFVPFIKGILCPFWAFVTLVTNTMVCVVLTSKKMISPTNVLLVAIACSDMLTGFLPVPCMLYFYASERYKDWVPYEWCFAYQCLTDFLPTIFHTSTIWLTVTLAAQRYIYVCRPVRAKLFCTIPNFIRVIAGIFVCSFLFHLCRFFENEYVPVKAISRLSSPSPSPFSSSSLSPLLSSSSSSSPLSPSSSSSSSLEYYYDFPSDQRLKPLKSVTTLPSHVISSDDDQPITERVVIVLACRKYLKGFINANKQTYFNVYYWSRVVFIHILPCVSLVLLNAALIGALRKASARRRRLLHYGDKKSSDAQMIVGREELVCVLEPRESHYGLAKGAEDKVTAYGRVGPPKSQRTTHEHGLKTQETSVHIKKSNCHLISIAPVDHSKSANIRSIPASNHGDENAEDKLQTKIFSENASHQRGGSGSQRSSKGIVGSAKALSVGKAALKGSKRSRATTTSVAMVAKTKNKQRRQAECNCTTLMLVVVVGLFLLVELPLAAIFVLQIIDNSLELNIINYSSGQIVTWVINMLILVGYSVNFVVYCAMNRDFRSTFRERIISFVFFCDRNSFPCQTKDDHGNSAKIQVVDQVLPSSRSISGFFHYGKPHSHRHRSFFHMSPKNRSYIKDKMAARPQSAAET